MRPLQVIGLLLVLFGMAALLVQGFALYTADPAGGSVAIDARRPHTVLLNPILGVAALTGGCALLLSEGRPRPI